MHNPKLFVQILHNLKFYMSQSIITKLCPYPYSMAFFKLVLKQSDNQDDTFRLPKGGFSGSKRRHIGS